VAIKVKGPDRSPLAVLVPSGLSTRDVPRATGLHRGKGAGCPPGRKTSEHVSFPQLLPCIEVSHISNTSTMSRSSKSCCIRCGVARAWCRGCGRTCTHATMISILTQAQAQLAFLAVQSKSTPSMTVLRSESQCTCHFSFIKYHELVVKQDFFYST